MKRFKTIPFVLMLFSGVALFAMIAPVGHAAEQQTVKIGMIASLTGPMAPAFKDLADAAKPTAEFFNKRGGVTIQGKKHSVEVITEDDQSSPAGAVTAMNRLIQQGVSFLLPPLFIPSNLAVTPLAEKAKILSMKSMGATRDQVNPNLRYSFAAYTFVYNAPFSYDYMQKSYPKAKKIALLTPDDPVGKIYRDIAVKELQNRNLDIVFDERFKIGSEDFYPILTRVLQKKPDVIDVVFCIEPWSAAIVNQSRELGYTGPVCASVGMMGDINILRGMIEPKSAHDLFQSGANVQSPNMPAIVKEYRSVLERTVKSPFDTSHVAVLDPVYIIVQAVQKAQSLDVDKVAQTLEGMNAIDTVYGPGKMGGEDYFGVKRVVRRPLAITGISDGKVFTEFSH